MRIETREIKKEIPKEELFPKARDKYIEWRENKERRKLIIDFLRKSEVKRRLGCWGRLWEKVYRGQEEWRPGKEIEIVLAEIFDQRKIFGENFKIFLASDIDDRKGKDLIIYNKKDDTLLTIDLTMNNKREIVNGKLIWSNQDNPTSINSPPEERKNNPKALRFVLALPIDIGYELMNRFYEALKDKNLENLKKDPLIIATSLECLKQLEIQLDKISESKKILVEREFQTFSKIISSQKEELSKEITLEVEKMEKYLEESRIGKMIRKIFQEI